MGNPAAEQRTGHVQTAEVDDPEPPWEGRAGAGAPVLGAPVRAVIHCHAFLWFRFWFFFTILFDDTDELT